MSKQLNIYLFNCDRTYKLKVVEAWLEKGRKTTKSELGIDLNIKPHEFSLSEMTQLSDKTIPQLKMDVAVFVVHAHESRLSINEENAGIGYAKLYRALLEKTGNRVIIVIGGDDNYNNKDERDREFISRWAKRKISSQFTEEFLDGRKGFIFSWDKEHRDIHEQALVHFFDPIRKGQKFEYHPPQRNAATASLTPPLHRARNSSALLRRYDSLPVSSPSTTDTQNPTYGEGDQNSKIRGVSRSGIGIQEARSQPGMEPATPLPEVTAPMRDTRNLPHEGSGQGFNAGALDIRSQGAWRKEAAAFPTETQEQNKSDLAVIGCNVSEGSIHAVMHAIGSFRPELNTSAEPPAKNLLPAKITKYLKRHSLQFCVLVVDGETVKDAYENLPARRDEYETLLKTAVERVAKKVVILVCGGVSLLQEDEDKIYQTIYHMVMEKEKGFIAWLKNGQLTVDIDTLAQLLTDPALTKSYSNLPYSPRWGAHSQVNVPVTTAAQRPNEVQQVSHPPTTPIHTEQRPLAGILLFKSKLRNGRISYAPGDVEFGDPENGKGLLAVSTQSKLQERYRLNNEIQLKIMSVGNEMLVCVGDHGVETEDNDVLLLKTRIRKGLVSLHENDVDVQYPGWSVPVDILEDLKRKEADGNLFVIVDKKGNLRCTVRKITKREKFWAFFTSNT